MQRRNLLIGMGSLAAGGAATIGTGAFTSVRAERSINVSTAGDVDAYLGLDASTSVYAEQISGQLELQFDGSNSGQNGDGLNANADTLFTDVFRIENNGTNDIRVQIKNEGNLDDLPDGPMAVFYSTNSLGNSSPATNATPFASSPEAGYWNGSNLNAQDLVPGDDFYVHIGFYLNESVDTLGESASTSIDNIPDNIGIYADSTSVNATPQE